MSDKNYLIASLGLVVKNNNSETKIHFADINLTFSSGWGKNPISTKNSLGQLHDKQNKQELSIQALIKIPDLFKRKFEQIISCEKAFKEASNCSKWIYETIKHAKTISEFSDSKEMLTNIEKQMISQNNKKNESSNFRAFDSEQAMFYFLTTQEGVFRILGAACAEQIDLAAKFKESSLISIILNVCSKNDTCLNCSLFYKILAHENYLTDKIASLINKFLLEKKDSTLIKEECIPFYAFISSNQSPESKNYREDISANIEKNSNNIVLSYNNKIVMYKLKNDLSQSN